MPTPPLVPGPYETIFVPTATFVPAIVWPDSVEPDPARWTQEDVTPEQKFKTARSEAVAAHQDAQNACKIMPNEDQRLCLGQARVVFDSDMQGIRQRFGDFR